MQCSVHEHRSPLNPTTSVITEWPTARARFSLQIGSYSTRSFRVALKEHKTQVSQKTSKPTTCPHSEPRFGARSPASPHPPFMGGSGGGGGAVVANCDRRDHAHYLRCSGLASLYLVFLESPHSDTLKM